LDERCHTRTLVFAYCDEVHDNLVRLADALPWAGGRGLTFGVLRGDVSAGVAEQRELAAVAAIGFLAADEPSVLAALAAGADEAAVLTACDAQSLAAFVDRLELRARLRAESKRLQETFAHAERLTALGTLVAGVGHEINNPLSAMMLSIEVARRRMLPTLEAACRLSRAAEAGVPIPVDALASLQEHSWFDRTGRGAADIFDEMGAAADAIASIVRDLRTFARSDRDEPPERVDVPELIEHAIRLSGREASRRGVVERDYAPDLPPLVVPRGRVTQVIMNLFVNALHAIAEVDRPVHRIRISARADEEFVAIAVSDTGPGIPPDAVERIFDPFFTTKRQAMGTGLGLSISRAILRRLGGELSVESVYGEGATFLCFLPIPSPDAIQDVWERTASAPSGRPPVAPTSVLVVEDDERVLRSYARLLGSQYRLMIACDGSEAIDMLESGSSPDVVLMELDLPGADGRELLSWLDAHRPELARRVVLSTSSGGASSYDDFLDTYPGAVVHKPVRGEALLAALESTVRGEA
jgi:signal transduction histidine kinase